MKGKEAWLSQNVLLELSHHVVRKPRLPAGAPGKGLVPAKVSANSQDGLQALWVDRTCERTLPAMSWRS